VNVNLTVTANRTPEVTYKHLSFFVCIIFATDVDECSNGTAGCEESCSNTLGSYNCYCEPGYIIGQDGVTCQGNAL
jgi:hypothetical protein